MNTKNIKHTFMIASISAMGLISCQSDCNAQLVAPNANQASISNPFPINSTPAPLPTEDRHPSKKIKLALILDTSSSMDGLIDQAKSQLWGMVNKLADAKCDNLRPTIEIALYEYGNNNLNQAEGFIRLVTPLTQDLDQISEDLFSLTTNGGDEYCGQVITTSLDQLKWSESSEDLQVIFIAGNEPFNQGTVSYQSACKRASQNKVVVNTIYCGDFQEGINSYWKTGATLTGGEYMSISQNSKTVYIASPYDDKIAQLNDDLNDTYVYYGSQGSEKKEKQLEQDANAESYGLQNKVSRTVTKSKAVYKNDSWDLVDAAKDKNFNVEEVAETELNEEMKGMSSSQKTAYIKVKSAERAKIQQQISELGKKRSEFVSNEQSKNASNNMLDNAMLSAISKQAKAKHFEF